MPQYTIYVDSLFGYISLKEGERVLKTMWSEGLLLQQCTDEELAEVTQENCEVTPVNGNDQCKPLKFYLKQLRENNPFPPATSRAPRCWYFQNGFDPAMSCEQDGLMCRFIHDNEYEALEPEEPMCSRYLTKKGCPWGDGCNYRHELKDPWVQYRVKVRRF